MRDQIRVCNDPETLAAHARDWLVQLIVLHQRDSQVPFTLALAGGSTPKRMYELFAELPNDVIDWKRVILLWGDERNVPYDASDSNYRMVKEALLDQVAIPAENIMAVPDPGQPAEKAADAYELLLREKLHSGKSRGFPKLNCVLLGIGNDVHTASLFPDTLALSEKSRIAVANQVPKLDTWRISFSAPMINSAQNVAFLIAGETKEEALSTLWHAEQNPNLYPAQMVRPNEGQLWFMLDKAALGSTPLPKSVMVQMI